MKRILFSLSLTILRMFRLMVRCVWSIGKNSPNDSEKDSEDSGFFTVANMVILIFVLIIMPVFLAWISLKIEGY